MGAKARAWVNRGLLVAAILAGVILILALPVLPSFAKAAILVAAALGGAYVAFQEIPAFDPLGRVHWRLPRQRQRTCAITFDDGPSAGTPRVVEILERHGVKATFFVLAGNARRHPEALRALAERGHTVAIHGVTHRKVHHHSEAEVEREVAAAIEELSALGVPPARLYRPPHGLKSGAALRAARKLGCQLWAWSRGIWDTDRPAPEVLVKRATRFARSRMVLLLHDGRGDEEHANIEPMLAALPGILERLRAAGFTFSTLDRA
ncbi:MAG TPA: polysaccharide deacetylase family protein [Polyangia bacterium]|jgi:peptidoglycan/xylan/chitin deacetylase (PgdA/CDA1 family)